MNQQQLRFGSVLLALPGPRCRSCDVCSAPSLSAISAHHHVLLAGCCLFSGTVTLQRGSSISRRLARLRNIFQRQRLSEPSSVSRFAEAQNSIFCVLQKRIARLGFRWVDLARTDSLRPSPSLHSASSGKQKQYCTVLHPTPPPAPVIRA